MELCVNGIVSQDLACEIHKVIERLAVIKQLILLGMENDKKP